MTGLVRALGRAMVWAYVGWLARRHLDGIWVSGLEHLPRDRAFVVASNHVAWWDGIVARHVDRVCGLDTRTLVNAAGVARLPFLRWFGAVALPPGAAARRALLGTAAFLDRPGRAAWIYPQGRQRPAAVRPLGFQRGVELLTRRSGALVVPAAVDYVFREAHVPAAVVAFGPPVAAADLEPAVEALLAQIRAWGDGAEGAFHPLLAPPATVVGEGPASRLLARGA